MLRHHHVANHHEAIAPSHLFQKTKEQVTPRLRLQKRNPAITTEGDEVQKSVAVAAIQSGHGPESMSTPGTLPVTDEHRFPQPKSPAFENREDRGSLS